VTIREIIVEYLRQHGYDGLCGDSCGCGLDDLAPCGGDPMDCQPAHRRKADCEACDSVCDAAGEGEWCYGTEKDVIATYMAEVEKAKNLICSACGTAFDSSDGGWRFNGMHWEHSHGQAGHFVAVRKDAGPCKTDPDCPHWTEGACRHAGGCYKEAE
jgi:hypothetical protein